MCDLRKGATTSLIELEYETHTAEESYEVRAHLLLICFLQTSATRIYHPEQATRCGGLLPPCKYKLIFIACGGSSASLMLLHR